MEKREKRGNFHGTWGKNIIFEKKGGAKYPNLDKYTPLIKTRVGSIRGGMLNVDANKEAL